MSVFTPEHNRILRALPPARRRRFTERMTRVAYATRKLVFESGQPIEQVLFPLSGVFSMVSPTVKGEDTAEVATVGNEAMVGLSVFLRTESLPLQSFAQVPGEALVMGRKDFERETEDLGNDFAQIMHRYIQAFFNQIAQHAACNAVHSVEERCARWLLMTHDRVHSDGYPLTHEFLSQMLGVRRAGVTLAAGMLQKAGLITYKRGIVEILDREGLESAACEHYRLIRSEYDRLLGPEPFSGRGKQG